MVFQNIAEHLGLSTYPSGLAAVYEKGVFSVDASSEAFYDKLEAEYGILGVYLDELKAAAAALKEDGVRLAYANTVGTYLLTATVDQARAVPMPKTDGTLLGNMYPLLILLTQVPKAHRDYVSRGFTKEEADKYMCAFCDSIATVEQRFNLHGINSGFYDWLCIYAVPHIFREGIFDFELRSAPSDILCLKKKNAQEYAILPTVGRFHKDGQVLGSAGFTEEEGAFDADFSETDDAFIGRDTRRARVSASVSTYPKSQWEVYLRPGQDVVSIHIPTGAVMTPENIKNSVDGGLAVAKQRYPEFDPKCAFCSSWLLDPILGGLLGENSKIAGFGNTFLRFPVKSTGFEMFNFVFPGVDRTKFSELPEETSLHRKLKALYQDGGCIHVVSGLMV